MIADCPLFFLWGSRRWRLGVLGLGGVFWDSISPPRRRGIASLDEQRSAEVVSREGTSAEGGVWFILEALARRQLAAATH